MAEEPSTPAKKVKVFETTTGLSSPPSIPSPSSRRKFSTRKRIAELAFDDDGVEVRALSSSDNLPAELQVMWEKVMKLGMGVGVMSLALKTHSYQLFLQVILVHGHEWVFAATIREANETILWVATTPFGSTGDVLGVYKIVRVVQELAVWSRDTYWHWYKGNVLGMPVADAVGGAMEKKA